MSATNSNTALFTPKQVATALGVSESSVKRWCDNGRLNTGRTVGGHRKVPLSSILTLVRETGQELASPEALGMVAVAARRRPDQVVGDLYDALLGGDEQATRKLLLGLYQQGSSIVDIGDDLVSPVFARIGEGWQRGDVSVHEERRACEVTMAVLHELRRWLPAPPEDAPLAITGTPQQDFAEVPIRMVEVLLQSKGWRTAMAGSGLPLTEIRDAVILRKPQLLCLSVTHLADTEAYIAEHNELMAPEVLGIPCVMGGNAFSEEHTNTLACSRFARKLSDLATWLDEQPELSPES